jgi:transcriptional regulator with XRE-family HTH domain
MDNGHASRVAAAVRAAYEANGISLNGLATATGIPRNTLRRRLDGHAQFGVSEVAAIAGVLGVDVASLLAPDAAAA